MSTQTRAGGALTALDFIRMKSEKRRISMVTCYDAWSAKLIDQTEIDSVLVGDSVSMVVHGHPSTVHATTEMMAMHTAAVARGLSKKFLIADMPFLSFRKGEAAALECVDALMKSGAHAVKIEGVHGHEEVISRIVDSGVPVIGHLGLTPQSIHQLGGFKVQGRTEDAAQDLIAQAKRLEELGCFGMVLECIPSVLAGKITAAVGVPTIGIGAGIGVDGQVLVLQDLLGMSRGFRPKFLKKYAEGAETVEGALNRFHQEVLSGAYPSEKESY